MLAVQEVYLSYFDSLKNILGISAESYSSIAAEDRAVVRAKTLHLMHCFYNLVGRPSFLLLDSSILYDAHQILRTGHNDGLDNAVGLYIVKQIEYLAGYGASKAVAYDEFLTWIETEVAADMQANKVICTSFYKDCTDISTCTQISSALILQGIVDARDVLEKGIGVSNGLRLAALLDAALEEEDSRKIVEESHMSLINNIYNHDEFICNLTAMPFFRLLSADPSGNVEIWREAQKNQIEKALKSMRRTVLMQKRIRMESERKKKDREEYERLEAAHNTSVATLQKQIGEYNTLVAQANNALKMAQQYEAAQNYFSYLSECHELAADRHTQNLIGAGNIQHNVSVSLLFSKKDGVTVNTSHSINRGITTLASASSSWNSVSAHRDRALEVVAQVKEAQQYSNLPASIVEPLQGLKQFIAENEDLLHGHDFPKLNLATPETHPSSLFFDGFVPGDMPHTNFAQKMVEHSFTRDKDAVLQDLGFTPGSVFSEEAYDSVWSVTSRNIINSNWAPATRKSGTKAGASASFGHTSSVVDKVKDIALTVVTGSSAAEANPMIAVAATDATIKAAAAAAIIGSVVITYCNSTRDQNAPKFSFGQLYEEIIAPFKKSTALHAMVREPHSARHAYDTFIAEAPAPKSQDTMYPGGAPKSQISVTIPPYRSHGIVREIFIPGSTSKPVVPNKHEYITPKVDACLVLFRERTASGEIKFVRWNKSDAIDKPLPDGSAPSWNTVRQRYWKNRYEASKNTGEFDDDNLERMLNGLAPKDVNPRTGKAESREIHHVIPQRHANRETNHPLNLRELTPDQHAEVDPYRQISGISTTRGIR